MKREQAEKVLKRFEDLENYEAEIGSYDYGRGEDFYVTIREKEHCEENFFVDMSLSLCLVGFCYTMRSNETPCIVIYDNI